MDGESDALRVYKILVCGSARSGKTELIRNYADRCFGVDTKSRGIEFSLKNICIKDTSGADVVLALQIWDLAGEKKFRTIVPYYIAGSSAVLYVFNTTKPETLIELQEWVDMIKTYLSVDTPSALVSTKQGLMQVIPEKDAELFAKRNNIDLYSPISDENGRYVNETFEKLAEMIFARSHGY
ncbi:MAG: Rab family GTPase [Candidatus Odinarchaeota archaeon]